MLYLEPATRDLFPAPICKHSKETIRLYDNTCRCARGPTAVDTSTRGLVRGNCTGLDEDTDDNLSKVWCFLENVRDPLNPQSGCYSDVTWSEKDGRFWSSIACYEVKKIITKKITSTFVLSGSWYRRRCYQGSFVWGNYSETQIWTNYREKDPGSNICSSCYTQG